MPTATRTNAVSWFEIPTTDFARSTRFYETVLDATLRVERFGPGRIAVFPYDQGNGVGGCLDEQRRATGDAGPLVYLDVTARIEQTLAAIEVAGGRIVMPLTPLPPGMGRIAQIIDSEGNRVGLHAKE